MQKEDDVINQPIVLVLNRNWLAIDVRTPQQAFVHLATATAMALHIDGTSITPMRWEEWIALPVREGDRSVRTPRGLVRIPTVLVLARFNKVPRRRPRFGVRALWARDGGRCQYTGRHLKPGEGNIDHIVPVSRGGATSWENCVLSCREVNSRKADRLPAEAGLRLMRNPFVPRELPVLHYRNLSGVAPEARQFLGSAAV
ncbi:HNH endonuclease [Verrucomicrobia bacterium LW23]|nr:HNH endonuclease [Verrucomicrobia bacterium LW23]